MRSFSDELYHYGVKGMKWGVRHDYEKVGRKQHTSVQKSDSVAKKFTSTLKKLNTKNRDIIENDDGTVTVVFDKGYVRDGWYTFQATAKEFYDNSIDWGETYNQEKWDKSYAHAAEFYSDFERAMLAAYGLLVKNGLTERFDVCMTGDPNGEPKLSYYDMKTKKLVPTLQECFKLKNEELRNSSRKRNISDPSAKVEVKKGNKVSAHGAAASQDSQYTFYDKPSGRK